MENNGCLAEPDINGREIVLPPYAVVTCEIKLF